jgi:hypothetical protein
MTLRLIPVLVLALLPSCAAFKTVARTADDAARILCELHFKEAPPPGAVPDGVAIEEAAKTYCEVQEHLRPWIDEMLRLKAAGVEK